MTNPSLKASLLFGLVLSAAASLLAQRPASIQQAVASITPGDIYRRIAFLADDSMKGRGAPSPELERASRYVAAEFRRFGLKPVGEGKTYFQRFPLNRVQIVPEDSFVRITGSETNDWVYGRDCFYPYNDWPSGDYKGTLVVVSGPFDGPAVFDTTSLAGRVVVVLGKPGLPGSYEQVAAWRPAAVLIAEELTASAVADIVTRRSQPSTLSPRAARFPAMVVRDAALAPILAKRGVDLRLLRQAKAETLSATFVTDIVAHVRIQTQLVERGSTSNVVGVLEGSDPKLAHQHLVYSAHMDHLGIRQPVNGDAIYNGADDNASGTATLLDRGTGNTASGTQGPRRATVERGRRGIAA